ncbi:MAG TPA: nucleoside hydrolase [Candidatus Handelsmanbacteria bacterium]|nr:nucleoside hydrolase [Candidatus Handelsmanbacteria bacterium]
MQPIILDVDMGVDDALAIMLALQSPEVELLGISTVFGNVPLNQATRNALQVLELMGRDEIPVYVGAGEPLIRKLVHAEAVHGESGLGDAVLPDPEMLPAGNALDFLIEGIQARPGEVIVIATGPLTNLALVEKKQPGILDQARRVLVMGGALAEAGNITPVSEFNSFADPHAFHQLIKVETNMSLIPLDVTHQLGLAAETIAARLAGRDDAIARFIRESTRTVIAFEQEHYNYAGVYLHDPAAVALGIDSSLCGMETLLLDVETTGELTTGQVVVDRRPFSDEEERQGYPVDCAIKVDVDRLMHMFESRVLGGE